MNGWENHLNSVDVKKIKNVQKIATKLGITPSQLSISMVLKK